jgi:hypothetical protein
VRKKLEDPQEDRERGQRNRDVLEGFPSKDPASRVHGEDVSVRTVEKRLESCDAG